MRGYRKDFGSGTDTVFADVSWTIGANVENLALFGAQDTNATGNNLFAGGAGNDTITTGIGADIIAFNRNVGLDTVNASTGADNTLSIGGGVT